jgi:hypothetical protein
MDDAIERSNDEIDIDALHRRYAAEREFQNNCVPSAYNYDGHVTKSVQYNLFHPAGPLAYIDRLAKWREEGSFPGLERTYDTAGA